MSPNLSMADEYALKVKQQVHVGMSVTFSEGGVERISDLEEGDTGVVLNIDSAGSLNDFNVKVRRYCLTKYHYHYVIGCLPFFYILGRLARKRHWLRALPAY